MIDVSTHQLAELTEKALNGKVSLEQILEVWHGIGRVIKTQLAARKGVKMPSFGTFTFDNKGEPIFVMASDMSAQFKLRQRAQSTPNNTSSSILNFSQVKESCNNALPREAVEKIYTKFMTVLGRAIFEGRNILITIHRVCEITIGSGELSYSFMPDFFNIFVTNPTPKKGATADHFRDIAKRTSQSLSNQRTMERNMHDIDVYDEAVGTGFQIGSEAPARVGRVAPRGRERNPITGELASETSSVRDRRPASAGKARPASAGRANPAAFRQPNSPGSLATNSLMYSPKPNMNQTDNFRRPSTGGGLRKEDLDRHARTQAAAPRRAATPPARTNSRQDMQLDPRKIAAKALNNGGDVIEKVRAKIVERGGSAGLKSITKLLAIMDDNGDKRLSKDELRFGLRDYGIDLNPTELEQVFLYFDRDNNGFIDVNEFLVGIKGDMPEKRRRMVRMAFDLLDTDGSGVISTDEILEKYDLNWHPEVRAGRLTIKEAAKDFMKQWDKKEIDGQITIEEFEDYYKDISASIDNDDYFELMIRNAWRIAGGEGAAANTANRRVLVTNKDGSQSVQTIHHELGMKGGDMEDARRRLAKQGVNADKLDFHGGYEDMNNNVRANARRPGNPARGGGGNAPAARPSAPAAQTRRPEPQGRVPTPRQAWMDGPSMGDQNLPSGFDDFEDEPPRRGSSRDGPARSSGGFDPFEVLHKMLYTPPVPLENLCIKLQVSSVNTNPRMAQGGFIKRMSTLDPSLSRGELQELWKVIDPKNVGSVEVNHLHDLLSNRFGKDKTSLKGTGVIERMIKKILERCGEKAGIKGLSKTLAIMDNSGDKKLSKEELKYGLQDYGIEINIRELDEIFNYFDRDRSGTVDIDEFLVGIKGDLNERRTRIVRMAFDLLDTDGSGCISVDEMMERYNFKEHPEVKSGKKTPKEAMREFMAKWDKSNSDGIVQWEEFLDYYKELSASIDGDDYFELMIRNAWRIAGGEGAAANTANRRVLVTNKDGSQSVQTIHHELGMKGGDMEDARRRLAKQGVNADKLDFHGGYEDSNSNQKMRAMPKGLQQTARSASRGRPDSRGGAPLSKTAPAAPVSSAFERHSAAAKLAAAYRGRLGRKKADQEKRKVENVQRERYEEEMEANRPKARDIVRPKGKSYIGF